MASYQNAKQKPGQSAQASTSLIVHIELPAIGQRATLHFALDPSKSERVFGGLYDFVSGISREWDDELLEFDLEGTELKLETLRTDVAADVDSWNKKLKDAEEWRRKVDHAATTMNKMRDAYYKELFHLREQVYRQDKAKKEGSAFQPDYALHFDPGEFTMEDEVARLVAAKTALLEQEFQTQVDELEVRTGTRIRTLTDQLKASKMSGSRKDKLLETLRVKHGWDHQQLLDMLNSQKVDEEKLKTNMEARAEEAEELATIAFKVLAEKQAESEEVRAEARALREFLEGKYGSLNEATTQLSQTHEVEQLMGLSQFQEFSDRIGYQTDARRSFVRLSGGNLSISLNELMERLMKVPLKAAKSAGDKRLARRRSANDMVQVREDKSDKTSIGLRRQKIDLAIAAAGADRGRIPRLRGDGSSPDLDSESSGLSEAAENVAAPAPLRSLRRRSSGAKTGVLKVSCEVLTDITFDSGARAAFTGGDLLKKQTGEVGCNARPYEATVEKRHLQSRGCQSIIDGRLLDKAMELFNDEAENTWSALAGLDVEDVPHVEKIPVKRKMRSSETTSTSDGASEKSPAGGSAEVADDVAAEGSEEENGENEAETDSEYQGGEAEAGARGEEDEVQAAAASGRNRRCRHGSAAQDRSYDVNDGLNDAQDASLPAIAPGEGSSPVASEARSVSPQGRRPRGRAPQTLPTLGDEEFLPQDGLLPPAGEPSGRIKKALGQAMVRHLPGMGSTSMSMFGGQNRASFQQTGGTGESCDPVPLQAPACDAGVQTNMTAEQALAALDWEPSHDIRTEEQVKFLLHVTQEIESRLPKVWEWVKKLVGQHSSSEGDQLVRRLARWPIGDLDPAGEDCQNVPKSESKMCRTSDFNDENAPPARHTFGGALGQRRAFDGRQEPILRASLAVGDGLLGDGLPDGEATSSLNSFRFKAAAKQLSQPGREFVDDHVLGLSTPAARPILRKGRATTVDAAAREEYEDGEDCDELATVSRSLAHTARRRTGRDRVQELIEEAKRRSAANPDANYTSETSSAHNFTSEAQADQQELEGDVLAPGWSGLVPRVSFSSRKAEMEVDDQGTGLNAPGADRSAIQAPPPSAKGHAQLAAPERKSFGVGRVSFGGVLPDDRDEARQRQTEPVLNRSRIITKSALKASKFKSSVDSSGHRRESPVKGTNADSDSDLIGDEGPQLSALGDLTTSPRRLQGLPATVRSDNVNTFRQQGALCGPHELGIQSEPARAFRRRNSARGGAPPPVEDLLAGDVEPEGGGFLPPVLPMLSVKTDRTNPLGRPGQASSSATDHFVDGLDTAGVQVRVGMVQDSRRQRSQLARVGSDQAPTGQRQAPARGSAQPTSARLPHSDAPSALRVDKQLTSRGSAASSQAPVRDLMSDAPNALRMDKQPAESPSKSKTLSAREGTRKGSLASTTSPRASSNTGADMERVTFSGVLPSSREANARVTEDLSPGKRGGRASFNAMGQGSKAKK